MAKDIPLKQNMPVTVKMFSEFRSELNARFNSFESKMESRFEGLESKFSGLESRFSALEAKMSGFDSRFSNLESQISGLNSKIHQILLLVETQTAQNAIALDGVRHALAEVADVRRDVSLLK